MTNPKASLKKTTGLILSALILVGLVSAGLGTWKTVYASMFSPTPTSAASEYKTSTVRKGSLAISVLGNGETVAAQSYDLAFAVSGTLADLKVQVGDTVSAGQELASLDSIATLKQTVAEDRLALQTAQKSLEDLLNGGEAAMAQALADQSAAEAALVEAQNNLHDPHDWRCPDSTTNAYYQQYLSALVEARPWQALLSKADEVQKQYYLMNLNPILKKMDLAYINYTYCQAYTPAEIAASQADLQVAQAGLAQASAVYQVLQQNGGIDPTQRTLAEAKVKDAGLQLTRSEQDLLGATLLAPAAGTVTALNGSVGQVTGSGTFLTIIDTASLEVQAAIDETDLSSVAPGCPVKVTFSSLSGKTFSGKVSGIDPTLVSSNGASSLQIRVALDSGQLDGVTLPIGATAQAIVTCSQTQNALLIPAAAIRQAADGTSFVYVLNAQNGPEKRSVAVGLSNGVTAEILSGLQENEKIITSEVKLP